MTRLSLPIFGSDIVDFLKWVNWHDFTGVPKSIDDPNWHNGYDFAAYLNKQGQCVLGLPSETPVRAIADGEVLFFSNDGYQKQMILLHEEKLEKLMSYYGHVVPCVEQGQRVKSGEQIATLYKDQGNGLGLLVHLHLAISNSEKYFSPATLLPEITDLVTNPQGVGDFVIPQLSSQLKIISHDFRTLHVNGGYYPMDYSPL